MTRNNANMLSEAFDDTPDMVPATQATDGSQPSRSKKKGRGPMKGSELEKHVAKHGKVTLEWSTDYKKPVGEWAVTFSKQIGLLVREIIPPTVPSWKLVTNEMRDLVKHKLLNHFVLDLSDRMTVNVIHGIMQSTLKESRYELHEHYKAQDPSMRRLIPHSRVHDPTDWELLCNKWETEEYTSKSKKAEESRAQVHFHHRAGSHSFVAKLHELNKASAVPIGAIELFRAMHYKEGEGWVDDYSEGAYNQMVEKREELTNEREEEGSTEPIDEIEIVELVLGTRTDSIKGLGRIPIEVRREAKGKRVASSSTQSGISASEREAFERGMERLQEELQQERDLRKKLEHDLDIRQTAEQSHRERLEKELEKTRGEMEKTRGEMDEVKKFMESFKKSRNDN